MKNLTFTCSVILILLGAIGYLGWESIGAEKQSITAAIPAFIGIPMLIGGIIAIKKNALGIHIAVLFSLFGALAALGRIFSQIGKEGFDFAATSTLMISAMAIVCVFYTVMAVRSFIAARKARG